MAIDNHAKPSRKLPYPVSQSLVVDGMSSTTDTVPLVTPDFFPTDPDEKINVTFNLSLNEFVTIASAIDIGRDIGYGEQSYEVWRLWCKALIGEITVACEDIADCVEEQLAINPDTNEPVNQAFYDFITNTVNQQGYGNTNRVNATQTTIPDRQSAGFSSTEIKSLPTCDLNKLWAGIRHGIVSRLDDNARDMLEDLAALNDVPQRYQAFIDIVPVLGDVAEAVATAATEVIPDILNGYNSYSSEAQLDEIACDIFSLVCAECRYPTFEELFNYYATLGFDIGDMDALTLATTVTKLAGMISGSLPASVIYHTTVVFQLFVLYLGAKWNGASGLDAVIDMATLGEDYANDNWLQLCNSCNQQYQWVQYDFTQSPHGFTLYPLGGTTPTNGRWVSGVGWQATLNGVQPRVVISKNIQPGWVIRSIGFNYIPATPNPDLAASGITLRVQEGSNTGAANLNEATGANYNRSACGLVGTSGYSNVAFTLAGTGGQPASDIVIDKAFILYNRGQGEGTPIASSAQC